MANLPASGNGERPEKRRGLKRRTFSGGQGVKGCERGVSDRPNDNYVGLDIERLISAQTANLESYGVEFVLNQVITGLSFDIESLIAIAATGFCFLQYHHDKSNKEKARLETMLFEAKGCWEEAEKAYSSLLEDNSVDQVIHRRRVAIAKAQGDTLKAIELLIAYLEIFMTDHEAWRELAEIYVSMQMFVMPATF